MVSVCDDQPAHRYVPTVTLQNIWLPVFKYTRIIRMFLLLRQESTRWHRCFKHRMQPQLNIAHCHVVCIFQCYNTVTLCALDMQVTPDRVSSAWAGTSDWYSFVPADSLKMALWCRNMEQFDVCIDLCLVEWIRRMTYRIAHLTNSRISSALATINTVRI